MSHIVSLRSASLRALRSTSTASTTAAVAAAATKCSTYTPQANFQQQQYSYSTLPPSSTRKLSSESNQFSQRVSVHHSPMGKSVHSLSTRRFPIKRSLLIQLLPVFTHSLDVFTRAPFVVRKDIGVCLELHCRSS